MKVAREHIFTGTTQAISSYDDTKTLLGTLMKQNTGATSLDKYVGPRPIALARMMEESVATPGGFPFVIPWSSTIDWVFVADVSNAALTRKIVLYEFNKTTNAFTWKGYITLNWSSNTGNKTIKALRVTRSLYTTGTVSVSGTAVTGSSTAWQTARFAVGGRIGFGSTDPTAISTWYEISAIGSDTGITLSTSAGTVSGGTSYVIEELRVVVCLTNATATNGGLFVAKGLNYSTFSLTGTNIADNGINSDNIRGVYWLADASTVTNTISVGLGIDSTSSNTSHYVWVLNANTTTTVQIFKYDIRASLGSITNGKSTSAFVLKTAVSGTLTGTIAATITNNGRIITASHGPGSGEKSYYFTTTSRIYRCREADITDGGSSFLTDAMNENPPGGTSTYAVTSVLTSVDYADSIDRLVVMTTGTSGARSYVTQYNPGNTMDFIFLIDSKQLDQSSADSGSIAHPTINASLISVWSEGGILYMARHGTSSTTSQLYAIPLSAHWTFAATTNQRVITPSISTSGATKLYRAYVNTMKQAGTATMGHPPEAMRMYFRTSGIDDDSGNWTLLDDSGDMSGTSPGSEIQFMMEFKTIGTFCIPNRVYALCFTYEDDTTDSHYEPSVGFSSTSGKRFAWRFSTAFGSSVPDLRVRLYNAVSGGLLVDDDTSSPTGTFERSTDDGGSWSSWNNTDKGNDTTYLRYTPDSLGDDIKVRALLTQL